MIMRVDLLMDLNEASSFVTVQWKELELKPRM
jgi:hypothetical protein